MLVSRHDSLLLAITLAMATPVGCKRVRRSAAGNQATADRGGAIPVRPMESPPRRRTVAPEMSRMAPSMGPAAGRAEMPPPKKKKMPRSAFRATVSAPKRGDIAKLIRVPAHTFSAVLSVAPRGATRWVAVLSARKNGTRHIALLIALLDKVNRQWRLVWTMKLETSTINAARVNRSQAKPKPTALAKAKLLVRDWDHDGKAEALIRYWYEDVKHRWANCALQKVAIINLDGLKPRVAVKAPMAKDCDVEGTNKGYLYHRDLNKDGHPDLQVVNVIKSIEQRGDGVSPGVEHFEEVDRKEVQYLWDWKTDTYKQGKTIKKSYSKPHEF